VRQRLQPSLRPLLRPDILDQQRLLKLPQERRHLTTRMATLRRAFLVVLLP
jgi:hypothetical protein